MDEWKRKAREPVARDLQSRRLEQDQRVRDGQQRKRGSSPDAQVQQVGRAEPRDRQGEHREDAVRVDTEAQCQRDIKHAAREAGHGKREIHGDALGMEVKEDVRRDKDERCQEGEDRHVGLADDAKAL